MTPAPTTAIERGSCARQLADPVARDHQLVVQVGARRRRRLGADGEDDPVRAHGAAAAGAADHQRVGIDERGLAADDRHVVAAELVLHDLALPPHHVVHAGEELLGRGPALDADRTHRVAAPGDAGVEAHGLAQGLAGDRAGLDADAADDALPLDDRGALAQLGGLHGGPLAGRAAAH
jgi:hypothetical protein